MDEYKVYVHEPTEVGKPENEKALCCTIMLPAILKFRGGHVVIISKEGFVFDSTRMKGQAKGCLYIDARYMKREYYIAQPCIDYDFGMQYNFDYEWLRKKYQIPDYSNEEQDCQQPS